MAISSRFLDDLRERIGLAGVVGKRVRLTKKGREHSGLCPFHKEKSPSFTVNEEKGFYHCFGCGAHGSAFDFVMETEGLDFREAVAQLASEVGMDVPQDTPEERQRAERKKSLYDVVEAACRYFESQLRAGAGAQALKYLQDRGLSHDTIFRFRLGYAPDQRQGLQAALKSLGITDDQLVAAGLIVLRDDGSAYERFRGRVIFPIKDRRGRVVAFGGRIMDDQAKAAKYLNSPETDLFHKGSLLYALDLAQVAARAGQSLVVAEGYMDVIVLNQAGFEGAVAPLGTALTEDQIGELWKIMPEAVLCFDGDKAGARAAVRGAERALPLLRAGVGLRFATLEAGEDPDSLVTKRGAKAFQEILDAAKPLSQLLWDMELAAGPTDSPEGRAALQKRLEDHVKRIDDATVRSHFQSTFKDRVWALGRAPREEWKGGKNRGKTPARASVFEGQAKQQAVKSAKLDMLKAREEILLSTLITHPELFDDVGERLGTLAFSTVSLDNLRQEALKTLSGQPGLDSDTLQRHLKDTGFSKLLDELISSRVFGHAYFARPKAELDVALEGWNEAYELYSRRDLQTEYLEAQRRLAVDATQENFDRFLALQKQVQTVQD